MKMSYIGAHISKESGSIIKTMDVINKNHGNALQLFVSNPRSASLPNMDAYKDISKEIQKYCKMHNFQLVIHAPYTINLAKDPKEGKKIMELADCYWIKLLLHQLIVADMLGAIGVVVHVGKYTSNSVESAMKNMYQAIAYIIEQMHSMNLKSKLIIETPAGAGTELLVNINDFIMFYNTFSSQERNCLGICLDTAHIWSAGYDINEYYHAISQHNAKDILVIHYNNSKREKSSHVDIHETLFDGKIPIASLKEFLNKLMHNPMIILEKPSNNLKKEFEFIESSLNKV
jgi:deoxyribonuclease-4